MERLHRWWSGLSHLGRSIVRFILLLPLVEIAFWALVEWVGGRQGWVVIAGVGGICSATSLLFSPKEVLEHPEFGGKVAKDYPILTRLVCLIGVIVCLAFTLSMAFARQLGLGVLN